MLGINPNSFGLFPIDGVWSGSGVDRGVYYPGYGWLVAILGCCRFLGWGVEDPISLRFFSMRGSQLLIWDLEKVSGDLSFEKADSYHQWEVESDGFSLLWMGHVWSVLLLVLRGTSSIVTLVIGARNWLLFLPSMTAYPVYHSEYDNYHWMVKFGDPLFHRHVASKFPHPDVCATFCQVLDSCSLCFQIFMCYYNGNWVRSVYTE